MERQVFRLTNTVLIQFFTLVRKKGIGMSSKWPKWPMKLNKTLHLKMFKAKINIMKLVKRAEVLDNLVS